MEGDMAVQEVGKRRIFLVCEGKPVLPEACILSAVVSAPDEKCIEYSNSLYGGRVPVSVLEGIRDLTEEEAGMPYTPRRVVNAYREILASYDGDVAVIASAGYIRSLVGFLECRDPGEMNEIEIPSGSVYEVLLPGRLCAVMVYDDSREYAMYRPMPSVGAPALMEYALDTLTRAGAAEVVIACDRNKERLENAFLGAGRTFADKEAFMQLLAGGKLSEDSGWDGVFLLPSSVPVFTLFSVQQLLRSMDFETPYGAALTLFPDAALDKQHTEAAHDGDDAAYRKIYGAVPSYKGKRGYPVLVRYPLFHKLIKAVSGGVPDDGNPDAGAVRNSDMNNEKYLDSDNNNENSNDINNDNNVIIDEKIDGIINENINGNDGVNDSVNGSRNDCVNDSGIIDDGIEKQEFAAELMDMIRDIAGSDHVIEVSVPDPAVVLRAGTSSGCEKVKDHLFSLRTPGLSYCRELLQWVNMSKGRLRHSEKVAFYAREMAEEFNSRGRDTYSLLLDENITAAGGMLHDIAKGCPGHAAVGAAMLRSLNMARAAEIVENHQLPAERYFRSTSPVLIVYLADKMFLGDKLVGIEERFRRKREKHEGDERAQKKLAYKEKQALRAKKVYENSILGWPVG
jgi:hypothetical protein